MSELFRSRWERRSGGRVEVVRRRIEKLNYTGENVSEGGVAPLHKQKSQTKINAIGCSDFNNAELEPEEVFVRVAALPSYKSPNYLGYVTLKPHESDLKLHQCLTLTFKVWG